MTKKNDPTRHPKRLWLTFLFAAWTVTLTVCIGLNVRQIVSDTKLTVNTTCPVPAGSKLHAETSTGYAEAPNR
jgi:hypothetical protein